MANGVGAVAETAAVPIEVSPARGAAVDFVMGAVAVGVALLGVSAVVCVICPATPPDVTTAVDV